MTVGDDLVDADVHPYPRSFDELREYVAEPWRSGHWLDHMAVTRQASIYVSPGVQAGMRADALPEDGRPAGSDPDLAERHLFDELGIAHAILIPVTVSGTANPSHEAALFAATNDWLADTWLSRHNGHGRYRGSICVSAAAPDLAAREIERWAGHPGFVQVVLLPYTQSPLGQRQYLPIYEAAARHGLPVAIHVNRTPGMRLLTPVGFVSYYFEHHAHYSLLYAPHLVSVIMEGVLERLPDLRFVLVEGGFSWIAPLLWRLDRQWHEHGREVPWLTRAPSEYFREQVRVTSQPIEEPPRPRQLDDYLEWIDAGQTLMFSTDYPHWDFDSPQFVTGRLPKGLRGSVLAANARELYRLPATARPSQPVGRG